MKKILLIDDEKDILEVLGTRLVLAGFEVLKAQTGFDGIQKARKEIPDLIVLDIVMPDMGGEEVSEELKLDPKTADIPVIFLTCLYTKQEEKKVGHAVGKNIFVAKPYDVKELLDLIRSALK
jgi:two-component system, OmpR family, alkaline phosphatase synthesis response regulator PhoP